MLQTVDVLRRGVRRFADVKREFAWVAAGQAFSFLGAFASVKILTNLLTPAAYGELAIGITIAGCVQMYVYGPLGQVVLRFLAVNRERGQLPAYFSVVKRLQVTCAVFLLGAGLVTFAVLKSLHSQWTLIALFGLLYGIVSGLSISFSQFQAAIRQRKIVALHQAADNWLRPLISVALLLVFRKSGYVALLAFVCATLLVDISQAVFAWRSPEVRTNWAVGGLHQSDIRRTRKEIISYAAPFVAWAGIGAISLFGDRWTLQYVSGAQQVGIYVALYQIASAPVSLTASVTNQLIIPIVFQRAGSGDTEAKVRSARTFLFKCMGLFAAVMAVLGLLVYTFSKPLARIATSAAIAEWHSVLWVIFAGIVCYHLGQQLTVIGQIERQMGRYVLAFATNAVATVVLSYILAIRMGILGVAWALLLSNFAFLIVVAVVNRTLTSAQSSEAPVRVVVTEN
jgi:O-antigen/teichoic acid export membrane protein